MGITQDIQTRLVAIQRTMLYDGDAVNAADYIPEHIQPHQLPLFVSFPIGGRRVQYADTFFRITRSWSITLWGRKEGDGLRSENELRMYDLIDAYYELMLPRQRLELSGAGLTSVERALLTGDNGIELRTYPFGETPDASFYMVQFNLDIEYRSVCT